MFSHIDIVFLRLSLRGLIQLHAQCLDI